MDYTVEIELQDHKRGDRWQGIPSIGPVLINDAQPAETLARVRMHFFIHTGTRFTLDSEASANPDAPITITDPATWEVVVPPVEKFLLLDGEWEWDMEFWKAGENAPLTLYKGALVVHQDIAK